MRFETVSGIRSLDAAARAAAWRAPGAPPERALMDLAALALADETEEIAARFAARPAVFAVCGKGDNGGDAALAAQLLAARGFRATVLRTEDAASWADMPPAALPARSIVLDGALGIGLRGAPRGGAAAAVAWTNRMRGAGRALVVAVDVPSGLDADTGDAPGDAVTADFTVTTGLPKRGFANPAALARCGEILVADISYPPEALAPPDDPAAAELFTGADARRLVPPRAWDSNKGDFGRVAVVAGSARYRGAPALASLGALRGGAGLVTAVVPREVAPSVAAAAPECMPLGYDGASLSPAALASTGFGFGGAVVLAGPGLSRAPGVAEGVAWLLSTPGVRGFVLDADALGASGRLPRPEACVLTPHPGEAARMLGCAAADVQADRPAAARELAERTGATVALKGAGTLVAAPGKPLSVVPCGNPGLARGGSGDILAGLCAAMLARGLAPFDAARAAVWRHGRAADLAAVRRGREAMLPTDLLAELR